MKKQPCCGRLRPDERELVIKKETVMDLWPSKKQWKSWTLPNKLTAIGVYVGIPLTILLFCLHYCLQPSLEDIVRAVTEENKTKLSEQYPRGSVVFGVTQKGFIVPKGLVPPTSKIQWDTGKVLEFTEKSIKVLLPHMIINTESVKGTQIAGAVVSLPKEVNAKRGVLKLPEIRIQAEVIGLHDQMVIIGVGFIPINNEDDSNTTKQ